MKRPRRCASLHARRQAPCIRIQAGSVAPPLRGPLSAVRPALGAVGAWHPELPRRGRQRRARSADGRSATQVDTPAARRSHYSCKDHPLTSRRSRARQRGRSTAITKSAPSLRHSGERSGRMAAAIFAAITCTESRAVSKPARSGRIPLYSATSANVTLCSTGISVSL